MRPLKRGKEYNGPNFSREDLAGGRGSKAEVGRSLLRRGKAC